MAITKLAHVNEAKRSDIHSHLRRLIYYIPNPKKTEECLWCTSNVGTTPEEIYQAFLDTKNDWEKPYGRQAYHIVIAFPHGEVNAETAFVIGKEFCRQYLGDGYDYLLGVHLDRQHIHCHIAFNSVNRITGLKYQYHNGDWEKEIQPLVDKICIEHGVNPLQYDKTNRKSMSYGEHIARQENRPTNKDILQYDIDNAVAVSSTFDEYLNVMRSYGYTIRIGYSEKRGCDYITYTAPWMGKGRRDYKLADGYSMSAIKYRIANGDKTIRDNPVFPSLDELADIHSKADTPLAYQSSAYMICTVFYHRVTFVKFDNYAVRKELMNIQKIRDECAYIINNNLCDIFDAKNRLKVLRGQERQLKDHNSSEHELKAVRAEKNLLRRIIKREETIGFDSTLYQKEISNILTSRKEKHKTKSVSI